MQNKNLNRVAVAAGFNRCGPCIAGGRADDGDFFTALFQDRIKQQPHQLQGVVLERQSRPVKQFQQPMIV